MTVSYRWSRFIQHRRGLLIMRPVDPHRACDPLLQSRLAFAWQGNYPEETTTRKA